MKRSPASGLYYTDYETLKRNGACIIGLELWAHYFGYDRVYITEAVVKKVDSWEVSALEFLQRAMLYTRKIRIGECNDNRIGLFMDRHRRIPLFWTTLEVRAKREGKIK